MSETAQRVGILLITLLFVGTTVGVTAYAIYANSSQDDAQTISQEELDKLTQQSKEEQQVQEQRQIEGFSPVANVPELKTEDLVVGTGAEAKPGDTVTVDYVGVLAATGAGFDNSIDRGQPATFGLGQVIVGWQEGIPGMKEGGKRRLYIPAAKAYGEQSPSPLIPANSDLVFDVTLIKVGQ